MIKEIICGGQTGVDLAAAQAALDLGIPQGGFCPKGRTNENGLIPSKFNFTEVKIESPYTEQQNIDKRTIENIRYSDGILIVILKMEDLDKIKDGTKLTHIDAERQKKPVLCITLSDVENENIAKIAAWVKEHNIRKLNVAGPRESTCPGIYEKSFSFFKQMFPKIKRRNAGKKI